MRVLDPRCFIPHAPPILMLDEVREIEPGQKVIGVKHLPEDCSLFEGHMPGNPLLPGVYIIEAIAQTGAVMVSAGHDPERIDPDGSGRLAFVRDVKFRSPVLPGETLSLEVSLVQDSAPFFTIAGKASVNGRRVAEGSVVILIGETG